MKNVIISNDNFLIKSLKVINDNVRYNVINNVRYYITDFSNTRKIIFVDDRVKSINLLSIRNLYRKDDVIVKINFLQDAKIINFFHHTINSNLPLNNFNESVLYASSSIKHGKSILDRTSYLTPMQAEVLSLFLSGMSIGGICSYFAMSRKNISNYQTILSRKYGCRNFKTFYKNFILE